MQPHECSYGEHQVLGRLWSSWTLIPHGGINPVPGENCVGLICGSPAQAALGTMVPLLLYAQHTRGHTDLLLPLQVHKMRAWRTSAPSLGPSLLQRKIHPPDPGCSGITRVASPLHLPSLHPLSRQVHQGQFGPRGLWASGDISGWQHQGGGVLWHPVGGSQGYCSTSSRA